MFQGLGGDHSAYFAQLEKEREERRKAAVARQAAIDAETDPTKRLAMRRAEYSCGDKFIKLEDFVAWPKDAQVLKCLPGGTTVKAGGGGSGGMFFSRNDSISFVDKDLQRRFDVNTNFNEKISLYQGDICRLEVGAVVNAANESLMGGGGIDGAIHGAAGPLLDDACRKLNGCDTGDTKITKGFSLPAEYILHTVGPMGRGDRELRGCYKTCLALVEQHKIRSVAFCCVGTGIFGFPLVRATHIALDETRKWMQTIASRKDDGSEGYCLKDLDCVIFCVFRDVERQAYEKMLPAYFPVDTTSSDPYVLEDGDDDFNRDDGNNWRRQRSSGSAVDDAASEGDNKQQQTTGGGDAVAAKKDDDEAQ